MGGGFFFRYAQTNKSFFFFFSFLPFLVKYNDLHARIPIILDNQILHIIQPEDHEIQNQDDGHDQTMHLNKYAGIVGDGAVV